MTTSSRHRSSDSAQRLATAHSVTRLVRSTFSRPVVPLRAGGLRIGATRRLADVLARVTARFGLRVRVGLVAVAVARRISYVVVVPILVAICHIPLLKQVAR